MNSLKKGEEVPLLNFGGGPGVPLVNFEGGPGAPLLHFEGGPGVPLWNFWGIPGLRVPRSWDLGFQGPGPSFTPCRIKMYWKSSEKFSKCIEKFKCSCNLCVTKVDNNLEITSVCYSLDLGNKIWIGKPFIDIFFHFKNPRLGCSFLPPVSFEII